MNFEDLRITEETIIDDEKIILSYGDTVLLSSNNISIINGLKGSMKSSFRDLLIRNLISPSDAFKSNLSGSVLVIDTEMSKRLIKSNLRRFENRDNLHFYTIKGLTIAEKIETTEKLIELHNPEILILDGSRDYLLNSNDPKESMIMINKLMYWVYRFKLHILNIVHSVRVDGGTKTKGTFGSELDNKAETIIKMATEYQATSKVTCAFSRETEPFKPFSITFNENGVPVMKPKPNRG